VKGIARVLAESGAVLTAGMLSGIYLYARLLPAGGYLQRDSVSHSDSLWRRTATRTRLASTPLARHVMRFRMRDGSAIRARLVDGGALLSVYADREYDLPGIDWAAARTIVDIGAHVGSFTIWAAFRARHARFIAVEPNPETFELLTQNIRENGLDDRVLAVNAAVGPKPGIGSLEFTDHPLGTRLAPEMGTGRKVSVQTVSGLLGTAGIGDIDVLKIDCEGSEYSVFEAMSSDSLRSIKALACEYHPEPGHQVTELDSLLTSAGFKVLRPNASLGVLWATR